VIWQNEVLSVLWKDFPAKAEIIDYINRDNGKIRIGVQEKNVIKAFSELHNERCRC
jgi:hypothetical protein